jgi:hypothetical protein
MTNPIISDYPFLSFIQVNGFIIMIEVVNDDDNYGIGYYLSNSIIIINLIINLKCILRTLDHSLIVKEFYSDLVITLYLILESNFNDDKGYNYCYSGNNCQTLAVPDLDSDKCYLQGKYTSRKILDCLDYWPIIIIKYQVCQPFQSHLNLCDFTLYKYLNNRWFHHHVAYIHCPFIFVFISPCCFIYIVSIAGFYLRNQEYEVC